MQAIEKRVQKLEAGQGAALSGDELLAAKWASLARQHPAIQARADIRKQSGLIAQTTVQEA